MESDNDPRQMLVEAERAGAAVYLDYPPTPAWFFPVAGVWFAAYILAFSAIGSREFVAYPTLLVLLVLMTAYNRWYRAHYGTMPTLRRIPVPEIAREVRFYAIGAVTLGLVALAIYLLVAPWAASAFALITVPIGLVWYHRRYEAAAEVARKRLA